MTVLTDGSQSVIFPPMILAILYVIVLCVTTEVKWKVQVDILLRGMKLCSEREYNTGGHFAQTKHAVVI